MAGGKSTGNSRSGMQHDMYHFRLYPSSFRQFSSRNPQKNWMPTKLGASQTAGMTR